MSATFHALVARFRKDLHCDPVDTDIEGFKRDLMKVNPLLMDQALVEVRAAGTMRHRPAADARAVLMAIYGRKVAEQARLFPVFHCFESAYRSTLARWMADRYQSARWWTATHAALREGADPLSVTAINSVAITRGVARALGNLVRHIEGDNLTKGVLHNLNTGDEVLREALLHDVEQLIVEHWSHFQSKLLAPAGGPPVTRNKFQERFRAIRDARNDTYHHKAVSNRPDIVRSAEALLDYIDVHLGAALEASETTGTKPYPATVAEQVRHNVCRITRPTFRLAAEMFADATCVGDPLRLTSHRLATVAAESAADAICIFVNQMTQDERACAGSIRLLPEPQPRLLQAVAAD